MKAETFCLILNILAMFEHSIYELVHFCSLPNYILLFKVQHTSLKLWPKESVEEFLSPDIENIEILTDSDVEN